MQGHADTWTRLHGQLGWQMIGPRVSGPRLEDWGVHGPRENKGVFLYIPVKSMYSLMDIMWPISQSHFHQSFLCSLK